jgi:hypothetical protein
MIKTKKKNNKIYVYENGELMWVENLKNPLKSWGATRFKKYAREKCDCLRSRGIVCDKHFFFKSRRAYRKFLLGE